MNKDRGMIKWLPFNSVISNKEILLSVINEKRKVSKPNISDDEKTVLEHALIDAFYMQDNISISYYKNGYIYEYIGKVKKIDSSNKLIYLTDLKLLFNQIIKVTTI